MAHRIQITDDDDDSAVVYVQNEAWQSEYDTSGAGQKVFKPDTWRRIAYRDWASPSRRHSTDRTELGSFSDVVLDINKLLGSKKGG